MRHQHISFLKSVIRILGYALLIKSIWFAAVVLVASEWIGIWEEIGHE
jgi:hypothetical protein